MNSSVCLCVLVAALAAGALAKPVPPADPERPGAQRDEEEPRRQLRAVQSVDDASRAHLGALLTRYIHQARKAPSGRNPSRNKSSHDYMGWMDFGRRSAQDEYEYLS